MPAILMLAALLLNLSSSATADVAAPGDYRHAFKKKRKPSEIVDEALDAFPDEAGEILQPFMVDGLSSLVDFRKLLDEMVAFQKLQAMLARREEEEMAMILAML